MRKISLEETLTIFYITGWKYDPETGIVTSPKKPNYKDWIMRTTVDLKDYNVYKHQYAWYLQTGEVPTFQIKHINKDLNDNRWCNLKKNIRKEYVRRPRIINIKEFKVKIKKLKIEKVYVEKVHKERKYSYNKLINKDEFYYWLLISKGKGKITPELSAIFQLLVEELSQKFYTYKFNHDRMDCKGAALLQLFTVWKEFNELRYDNCLSYFTEIAKRAMTRCYNTLAGKRTQREETPRFVSINKYME